jgi:hypothetical protein
MIVQSLNLRWPAHCCRASSFGLIQNEPKDQDRKMLLRTKPAHGPRFCLVTARQVKKLSLYFLN